MSTIFCKKCSRHLPEDSFGKNSDGSIRPQCNTCRNATDKVRRDWIKACKTAEAKGEQPPPEPARPAAPSAPGKHLNDIVCDLCGLKTKRQHLYMHKKWIQHRPEDPAQTCDLCPFQTCCFGHVRHHKKVVHDVDVPVPHRTKALWTCTEHMHTLKRQYNSVHSNSDAQREKARKRYAERPLESSLAKRAATAKRDASDTRQAYKEERVDPRAPHTKATPMRRYQKQFQEKSLRTRNMRVEWRYRNFLRVRELARQYHHKHRVERNDASAAYRRGNKTLKLQQIQHHAGVRGLEFTLPEEAAHRLMEQPCFYCGGTPDDTTRSLLHGFDRVHNDRGYVWGNVVPCCPACNVMKGALDVEALLCHVDKVYRYLQLGVDGEVREPTRSFSAADLEDKILQWLNGVHQSVLTNVDAVKAVVADSHIDPAALFNHRSRALLRDKIEWVRQSLQVVRDVPDDMVEDNCSPSYMATARGQPQDAADAILGDMLRDLECMFVEFDRMRTKRYNVNWSGKAEWRLSDEEAVGLVYKNECTYCGFVGDLGIDRIDPKGHYELGNAVPACATCNIMRSDLKVGAFLQRVKAIHATLDLSRGIRDAVRRRQHATGTPVFTPNAAKPARDGLHRSNVQKDAQGPARYMQVTTSALMLLGQRADQLRLHARVCGRGALDRWRVVDVAEAMRRHAGVQRCSLCTTTDASAPDCAGTLPDLPRIVDYGDLVQGIQKRRADQFVLTDMQTTYHAAAHGASKLTTYVVSRALVDAHLPHLRPCTMCVSTREGNAQFDGQMECPRVSTVAELEQCRRVLANEVHLLHSACKFKHHGKAIVAPKRVGAVFLRQTNSNIYHTALHGVMTAARTKIQTFQCLSVAERQRLKPCKTCVSVGTVGDELTMADALRVLS